ncbi:hypothetical protein [Escherichia phage EP_H11]|nr:hypothetical protein [Escherichia phage EP_H11]
MTIISQSRYDEIITTTSFGELVEAIPAESWEEFDKGNHAALVPAIREHVPAEVLKGIGLDSSDEAGITNLVYMIATQGF